MPIHDKYPDHQLFDTDVDAEDTVEAAPLAGLAAGVAKASGEWPKVFRTSRLQMGQVIFPQQLIFDEFHVVTRKRHFPLWWIVQEDSIPYSKIGSVSLNRGMLWSTLEIENTGGVDPIIFHGLGNKQAMEVRELVERMTSRR